MVKNFIWLEWKQFTRSVSFGKGVGIKILMAFFALYFVAVFLMLGVGLYPILKKTFPETDPFLKVNDFIFYWIIGDLIIRFFFQKLPVMSVKPLLTLPIKRNSIVHYVLGKSTLSFFNFLPFFATIPFGIVLFMNGYAPSQIFFWILTIAIITLIINFLNFIVESLTAESEVSFLPIIAVAGGLLALNYYNIVSFSELVSRGINTIVANPFLIITPILILLGLYLYNLKILRNKLFLDAGLKTKTKEINAADLSWTKRFGDIAPFMQLDLKLIWRNKRSKSSVFMLLIGLLYGLFFYPNPTYQDMPWFYSFVGIFVTGIFLINFGQFIPAWDSAYYKLLMSQNIKYEQYLKSKFTLMCLSVIILFVLSIPYVYFGWKILLAHFAAALYNIGVNSHVILFGGSFNRKKIELDQRAAFNFQGTGAVQWIIGIPLMIVPMLIFGLFYWLFNFQVGCLALALLGIAGIVLHQKLMDVIVNKYKKSKYKMIDAFSQSN
ncbi:hypothetical protein SAMN03097699_2691 [Flavobacteriaceae bacterium MAR_2010_188]|nr:hypothetical protein SAMN03097699_2691 [Flavobacteriaceae bacterium MAR_2010_188]